ncbi:MAG: hypothetical protein WC878_08285 [Candidatus Paceibacterota bacterium]|jgi:hypothetical protein
MIDLEKRESEIRTIYQSFPQMEKIIPLSRYLTGGQPIQLETATKSMLMKHGHEDGTVGPAWDGWWIYDEKYSETNFYVLTDTEVLKAGVGKNPIPFSIFRPKSWKKEVYTNDMVADTIERSKQEARFIVELSHVKFTEYDVEGSSSFSRYGLTLHTLPENKKTWLEFVNEAREWYSQKIKREDQEAFDKINDLKATANMPK